MPLTVIRVFQQASLKMAAGRQVVDENIVLHLCDSSVCRRAIPSQRGSERFREGPDMEGCGWESMMTVTQRTTRILGPMRILIAILPHEFF